MSRRPKILTAKLAEHPAVRAWRQLEPRAAEPDHIVVFKRKEKGAVYALAGIGPNGSRVIAKQCRPDKGALERTVYEHVLPRMLPSPVEYYGCVVEEEGQWLWLFLEDIGDESYNPDARNHRRLAAQWFGELQTRTQGDELLDSFPDRGAAHYLSCLNFIVGELPRLRERPSISAIDGGTLQRIADDCTEIESRWSDVTEHCASVPTVFSHNDCLAKNVHIRDTSDGQRTAPFDWGGAGWAPAGADLGLLALPHRGPPAVEPDYNAYRDAMVERWPEFELDAIVRSASLGQLFWALKVISRGLLEFDWEWQKPAHVLANLTIYEHAIARSLAQLRADPVSP